MTKQVRDWQDDMKMCEKASPEPWCVEQLEYMGNRGMVQETVIEGVTSEIYNEEDARFIAEAREALPYWLIEIKALCEVNQQKQREIFNLQIREKKLREAINEAIKEYGEWNDKSAAAGIMATILAEVRSSLYPKEEEAK